ncbi:MAG: phage antirepressor KilAC domain-containing protein [Weeksellaceae bacterium]|nr:phage antirepressor KilAC domain-containing protein [Weeksellaceae bacterium]
MYGYHKIEDFFTIKQVADKLNIKGFGQNKLFSFLREQAILNENNFPKEEYISRGFFKKRIDVIGLSSKHYMTSASCLVSSSGMEFIRSLILNTHSD